MTGTEAAFVPLFVTVVIITLVLATILWEAP